MNIHIFVVRCWKSWWLQSKPPNSSLSQTRIFYKSATKQKKKHVFLFSILSDLMWQTRSKSRTKTETKYHDSTVTVAPMNYIFQQRRSIYLLFTADLMLRPNPFTRCGVSLPSVTSLVPNSTCSVGDRVCGHCRPPADFHHIIKQSL